MCKIKIKPLKNVDGIYFCYNTSDECFNGIYFCDIFWNIINTRENRDQFLLTTRVNRPQYPSQKLLDRPNRPVIA